MRALGRLTYLHAGRVLVVALILLAVAAAIAAEVFEEVEPFDISDPDSDSVRTELAIEEATGSGPEPEVALLISGEAGDPTGPLATAATRTLRGIPGIARVSSARSDPRLTSDDGQNELVLGFLDPGVGRVEVGEVVDEAFASSATVIAGGTAVAAHQVGERSEEDARAIELYAAPVLLLLLLIAFRTLGAAMLPLGVAAFSILFTLAALRLITHVQPIDLFSLQVVTGLGVGLAIDYSLFVLARYREEVGRGGGYERAHMETLRSAGRAVAFSSLTVATALIALVVFPQQFLSSTGIAGALTALFAGIAALLVLPAAVALLGPSVDSLSVRRDPLRDGSTRSGFWDWLPQAVCRRPVLALLGGGIAMVAISSLPLGITLTTPDARELPSEDTARVVADELEEFGGLPPTSLFAIVPAPAAGDQSTQRGLEQVEGVSAVSGSRPLDGDSTLITVSADVDPLSEEGQDLVEAVRAELPQGATLGGRATELADQRSSISDHVWAAIAIVVLSHLVILAVMLRSAVLPLLALVMNLLTVLGSIGLMTVAFETEWIANLLGTDVQEGIDISVPVLAFAVIFGLSTDYGIFLLSRIREARSEGRSDREAIIAGVSVTGRLITASALLFATAVGAFAFSDLVIIKEFAVVVAVAVLIDATVVRGLLLPASLQLLGRVAWWWPSRSRRAG